nr:MAG TPA: hypothetical protein [Caudoviricetes sp.]
MIIKNLRHFFYISSALSVGQGAFPCYVILLKIHHYH